MISGTCEYDRNHGWQRRVEYMADNTICSIHCGTQEQYERLLDDLVNSQLNKYTPYTRIKYIRGKKYV
jgi:hypothetical protein